MGKPTRFSLALDFACAAMSVLLSGYVADEMCCKSITALDDEFAEIFQKRKLHDRLSEAMLSDVPEMDWRRRDALLRSLRRTSVMPSVAIAALAGEIGCDPDERPRTSVLVLRNTLPRIARKLDIGDDVLRGLWKTEADHLDARWHALRRELLKIRDEMQAASPAKEVRP